MAFEVIRHQLPLFDEEGRAAAADDEQGRDLYYLPDLPEEDPYAAGHRTCARRCVTSRPSGWWRPTSASAGPPTAASSRRT